ncbi:hypothetical protein GM668_24980 [Duganella ginsengisoli]|uniref:DUF3108 domain-containing protein n=2 Tax=Pseudoduganella ginsengisoli TaxID=1462440 RepID=A0A6L6Q7A9_9BURK|nr:hypothetical protein [Pseudoduganella ginsengisoli]
MQSLLMRALLLPAILGAVVAQAAPAAADLDFGVSYYTKVVTDEGVTRESRYEEKWQRRAGHVWVERVLPAQVAHEKATPGQHKHFNPVRLARHVMLEGGKVKLEYIDQQARERVAVPPGEYDNVSFNGAWDANFYLVSPKSVAEMPLSSRASNVQGARWREREKNGRFQRVLWDEQRQVALVIEAGDRAGQEFQRIEVQPLAKANAVLPWTRLAGFSQREYADFLD